MACKNALCDTQKVTLIQFARELEVDINKSMRLIEILQAMVLAIMPHATATEIAQICEQRSQPPSPSQLCYRGELSGGKEAGVSGAQRHEGCQSSRKQPGRLYILL